MLATAVAVVGVIAVTVWQLNPHLLLSNTTTTGGDTGAQYMLPAFLRTNLLAHGHLTGWDPAWYDGFPLFTYYFVLADLTTAVGSFLIPYNVAFKLTTIAGSVTLPVCAWACGRLFRLRPPGPAVLAAATLPFLFDYSFTIYGGNLFSTLAGEYAYSLSLSLAVLFLGLVAAGLRSGRYRGWAAVVFALCMAAHVVPAMFALGGGALLTALELLPDRFRLSDGPGPRSVRGSTRPAGVPSRRSSVWWFASTAAIGLLLSGWWLVPFGLRGAYATSMGYTNVTTYLVLFFPRADVWALVLAGVAIPVALVLRSRFGVFIAALGGCSALAMVLDPQGSLYNVRLLPFWFLCVYLLVGWLFATVVAGVARWWRRERQARWVDRLDRGRAGPRPRVSRFVPGSVVGPLLGLLAACVVVVPPFVVPASALPVHVGANEVNSWAAWNYSGYEGKPAYPEYKAIMTTMATVAKRYGCGRAMWEYNADQNRFGTPEALMLLPYWTGGCIDSMEGLFFESSATTPYHFLNQAELSPQPSEPMVGLPYGPLNVTEGVQHLQLLGVKYFLAASTEVQDEAKADPSLQLVASTGPWHSLYGSETITTTWEVFRILDSPVVTPLTEQPAVLTGVSPKQTSWLDPSVAWYDDPTRWPIELAAGGPSSWQRVPASDTSPKVVAEPTTTVSHVQLTNNSVAFRVSRVGTPVLVKVSYFPNWQASGAEGPWRVTPNLMVVVPTSHDVTLHYGSTHANDLGILATVVGLGLVGWLAVWPALGRWRRRRGPPPRSPTPAS